MRQIEALAAGPGRSFWCTVATRMWMPVWPARPANRQRSISRPLMACAINFGCWMTVGL